MTSRSVVIRTCALLSQNKIADADACIESGLKACAGNSAADKDRILLLKAQILINRGLLVEARHIISGGLSTIAWSPSVISSVYELYRLSGNAADGLRYLSDCVSQIIAPSNGASEALKTAALTEIARVHRSEGRCAEAAAVYQSVLSSCELEQSERLRIIAKLVEALSYTAESPEKYFQGLPEVL